MAHSFNFQKAQVRDWVKVRLSKDEPWRDGIITDIYPHGEIFVYTKEDGEIQISSEDFGICITNCE